ncbi:MAG TPA: hypothetical protein ENJ20_06785 [Bacteroidetes bacterium]|nr:hypothetical protein [Bacteroidota bacterium]
MNIRSFIFFIFLLLFFSCKKINTLPAPVPCTTICHYLFLGHIYETPGTVDQRIENTPLSFYEQIWLGGDLCSETTREESTLNYLNDLFDLGSSRTHWAVGNHDIRNGKEYLITSRTKRPTFYTHHFDGITLVVLNTNYSGIKNCDRMEAQTQLIRSVCDTIDQSSHLVLLMHHVVWGYVNGVPDVLAFANSNGSWVPFTCYPLTRFQQAVYPHLVKVQQRGIPVICIAGDFGQVAATYEFTTAEGITFLGSGITSQIAWNEQWPTFGQRDSVLVFTHNISEKKLSWKFIDIDDI